jgi:hypothetical protein
MNPILPFILVGLALTAHRTHASSIATQWSDNNNNNDIDDRAYMIDYLTFKRSAVATEDSELVFANKFEHFFLNDISVLEDTNGQNKLMKRESAALASNGVNDTNTIMNTMPSFNDILKNDTASTKSGDFYELLDSVIMKFKLTSKFFICKYFNFNI